jgi:hypothetical protein
MTKLILFALAFTSLSSMAADDALNKFTDYEDKVNRFNPRASHWLFNIGLEGMRYDLPFEYEGQKKSFSPKSLGIYGGRLGFGREFYLGNEFLTSSKIEGYYVGNLFSQVLNGGTEDENVKFAYTKETSQLWGFDVSQSFGRLYNMKTKNPLFEQWSYLTVEPFVEVGVGIAKAYNSINYKYALDRYNDRYKEKMLDDLINAKIGVGVNFTASTGNFFYFKVSYNRYDLSDRKSEGYSRVGAGATTPINRPEPDSIDPITVISLGGGYKF